MRKVIFILSTWLLYSGYSLASSIETIRVFTADAITISNDIELPKGTSLFVHNMDVKDNTTKKLNQMVQQNLSSKRVKQGKEAHQDAFSEILNGPYWSEIYKGFEEGGFAIEAAVRFKIKKLPAIVLNERDVIYGVYSLKEAVRIFNSRGEYQ